MEIKNQQIAQNGPRPATIPENEFDDIDFISSPLPPKQTQKSDEFGDTDFLAVDEQKPSGRPVPKKSEDTLQMPTSLSGYINDVVHNIINPGNVVKSIKNQVAGPVSNVPSSTVQVAKDTVHPLLHPIDTYKAFKELGPEGTIKAIADNYKQRYGSVDLAMQTINDDPVGAIADVFFITSMARATVTAAGRSTAKVLPKNAPERLYESGAKFGTTLGLKKRSKIIKTALDEKIPLTKSGVDKLTKLTKGINKQVDDIIYAAEKEGRTIPSQYLFRQADRLRNLWRTRLMADKTKTLSQFDGKVSDIRKQVSELYPDGNIPPSVMNEFKRDLYKQVPYDSNKFSPKRGTELANKSIARGAKEGIESVADVKKLNKEWGDLIDLVAPLEKSQGRIGNTDIFNLRAPLNLGVASYVAGPTVGPILGVALTLAESPRIKSMAAIMLHHAQNKPAFATKAAAQALAAGEIQLGRQARGKEQ